MSRCRQPLVFRLGLALGLGLVLVSGPAGAQELFLNRSDSIPTELEPVYLKGLTYLLKTQDKDGGWADTMYGSQKQPAMAGLAVLAMLAHGDDPNAGPYSAAIKRGLDYILRSQNEKNGYIGPSMYNHGFATLALAEAYGVVDDPRLGPALEKAVALILTSQAGNPTGAWRYAPEGKDADTTVSGAIFVALMAARNAGVAVPEEAVKKALAFYQSCACEGGGFGYTNASGPNGPRSAIGILVFALAKERDRPACKEAVEFLNKMTRSPHEYPFYYEYYASQALFQADPRRWVEWNRKNLKQLAVTQNADGAWEGQNGPVFSTSAALLSLALNYRFLPIYER